MHRILDVVESFVPFAGMVREKALQLDFTTVHHGHHPFHGIGIGDTDGLWRRVETLLSGDKVVRNGDFFRLGTRATPATTYIHADTDMGEFAGVLYLNTPEQRFGGTAFWRHKATGWDRMPDNPLTPEGLRMLDEDGMDDTKWELETKVGMQFNRFITYPTRMFHSRYPNHIDAEKNEDGRLVWACFYDLA